VHLTIVHCFTETFKIFEKHERCGIDRAVVGSDDLRNRQLGSRIIRAIEINKREKTEKREREREKEMHDSGSERYDIER